MKVAYLSSSILPSRAANSVHVMKMSQAFAKNGNKITLIAPNKPNEEEKNVNNIYQFYGVDNIFTIKKIAYPNIRFIRNIIYAIFSLFALFKLKPDLVYGRNLLGCYLASFFFSTSFEAHSPMESKLKVLILKRLVKRKKFKNLVVISSALEKLVLEQLPKNTPANLVVAHDGADEAVNLKDKVKLYGNPSALKVGYVGHLYPGKGMELIAKCLELSKSDVEFHIVGGMEKDILFWKNKTHKFNNIYFYGFQKQAKLYRYFNAFDICLLPNQIVVLSYGATCNSGNISDFTSPLKMFEYMSHKKAIVASDLPVLREVLTNKNALLCNPEDANEWVEALNKLKDETFRNQLATNAYNDFMKEYTWLNRARRVV